MCISKKGKATKVRHPSASAERSTGGMAVKNWTATEFWNIQPECYFLKHVSQGIFQCWAYLKLCKSYQLSFTWTRWPSQMTTGMLLARECTFCTCASHVGHVCWPISCRWPGRTTGISSSQHPKIEERIPNLRKLPHRLYLAGRLFPFIQTSVMASGAWQGSFARASVRTPSSAFTLRVSPLNRGLSFGGGTWEVDSLPAWLTATALSEFGKLLSLRAVILFQSTMIDWRWQPELKS